MSRYADERAAFWALGRPEDARCWWGPQGRPGAHDALIQGDAASPVLVAVARVRAQRYVHIAVERIREARETGGMRRTEAIRDAERFLGIAEGQVLVLFDTCAYPLNIQRAIDRVRAALRAVEVA